MTTFYIYFNFSCFFADLDVSYDEVTKKLGSNLLIETF